MWWVATALAGQPLSWDFAARWAPGEVRVLPLVSLSEAPALVLDTWIGRPAPPQQAHLRARRTRELAWLPRELWLAMPTAINSALGESWSGEFRLGTWTGGAMERARSAIGRADWDALEGLVHGTGGDAVLVTWLVGWEGQPLTAVGAPGEVIETTGGPVVVDSRDEPYLVSAAMGAALITRDGEVCVRYADRFEAILSSRYPIDRTGRDLARSMAAEMALVWVRDGELEGAQPPR